MLEKIQEPFFSFGIMVLGILILFLSPISLVVGKSYSFIPFPGSGERANAGTNIVMENFPASRPAVPIQKDKLGFAGSSTAASAIVVDTGTKTILFNKNKDEVRPLASISKLMSAMVLLDLPINWNVSTTKITDADYDGSDHNVNVGEEYTLNDLWHVALIGSSNMAIRALVRAVGLTTDEFAQKMNAKAKELRLFSAYFVEPTGLSSQNVANAYDTAKLLIDALKFDKIYTTVQIGHYEAHPLNGQPKKIWTTDWLLTNWVPNDFKMEDIAGKTGYITDSGYNFAVNLTSNKNHTITVVVLGTASNEERFSEARDLAEWTFSNFVWPEDEGYKTIAQ